MSYKYLKIISFYAYKAQSTDDWFGLDKLEHFVLCGLLTLVTYLVLRRVYWGYRARFTFSILAGLIVGLLKELGDYLRLWPGGLSVRDFTADAFGVLFVAAGLYILEQRFGPAPAPPPPPPGSQTTLLGSVRALFGLSQEPRVVDLEHGLVYGQRILRQYGNSLKDLRSLIPHSSALARWGGFDSKHVYGYKPLPVGAVTGGRGSPGGFAGGGGSSISVGARSNVHMQDAV
ncbi:hypothetical protein PLESTB_000701100 [Pleodorina starrii]|uniref:Uncharacterized protein n=1 Tax=Pleodorina starrii TaxID=330485 RepID=A0A9W6BIW2_9CHLO|nr:hypothetical protein PLESTM_001215600 [Pleodorina starrii]GLC53036.1 hypothetical protein PLESTB_000701100 [Pleodorina starrii]GLC75016.1 hypothetical protein PLESTF_001584000 [Pleodorina starrii]